MNIIKLHPDQDGSVWYIPEGLPGVLVIRNHGYTVFMIKKVPGSDCIPDGYRLAWMRDYDIVNDSIQHIPVNVYIEGQLNFLNQVYLINQPALTRVKRWFISKMK